MFPSCGYVIVQTIELLTACSYEKRIPYFHDFLNLSDCDAVLKPVPSMISDSMVKSEPQDINFDYDTDVKSEPLYKFFWVFYVYSLCILMLFCCYENNGLFSISEI